LTIGYSFFVGDLFHVGHLNQIELGKKECDYLIVGILSDEAVESYKRKPVIPLFERVRIFKALRGVDLVVVQNEKDPTSTLQSLFDMGIKVDVLLHGDDWCDVPGKGWIELHGGKMVQPPYYPDQSTSRIIEQIKGIKIMNCDLCDEMGNNNKPATKGDSFICWGKLKTPIIESFDGKEHKNTHSLCFNTPKKGHVHLFINLLDAGVLTQAMGEIVEDGVRDIFHKL